MTGSLEQAVARWLKAFPHDATCHRTREAEMTAKYGRDPSRNRGDTPTCTCDREQRLAARVAAAIEAVVRCDGSCGEEDYCVAAVRALSPQEKPK